MSRDLAAPPAPLVGLVLAAGAGTRFGGPKALAADPRGAWLPRAVLTLLDGGCDRVTVVLGAEAEAAEQLLADTFTDAAAVTSIRAADWSDGLSHSLAAGLRSLGDDVDAAVVTLVDLPALRPEAITRLAADARASSLRRALYDGAPGHPVLLGRDHWPALLDVLHGDRGAGPYLRAHDAEEVDCSDLGGGQDVDAPSGV